MTTIVRTLKDIAKDANREWDLFQTESHNAVQRAVKCGKLLVEAKERVEHGDWLPWLQANFHGSERHARVCMQLVKSADSADFESISEGLRAIAKAAEPEPEPRTSTKDVRNLLQRVSQETGEIIIDATVVEDNIDPRFLKARNDFQRVVELMDEAATLSEVSATDKRREAARLAKATANTLLAIL